MDGGLWLSRSRPYMGCSTSDDEDDGRGAQSFRKSTNRLKILGVGRLTEIKFHVEEPRTLGSNVRNVIATATWWPEYLHSWFVGQARYVTFIMGGAISLLLLNVDRDKFIFFYGIKIMEQNVSFILGYGAASRRNAFPTSRSNIVASSSRVEIHKQWDSGTQRWFNTLRTGAFKLFKCTFPGSKQFKSTFILCFFKYL